MIQIDTNSIAILKLTTYDQDGFPVNVSGYPTVQLENPDTGAIIASGQGALVDANYPGEYEYEVPRIYTSIDRVLKVVWTYYVNQIQLNHIEYLYVITPYNPVDEIIEELGLSSRPEDVNYYPYEKIISASRTAKMIIDNYLGFSIGKSEKTIVAYGNNTDILNLPSRIISFDILKENDLEVINKLNNINIFGYDVEITETNYALRIAPNLGDDILEYEKPNLIGINHGKFRDGYRYEIYGTMGWNYIPLEVKQANFLIINDLLCTDSVWRNKYVKKINTGQTSIELSGQAYFGTGNALADNILNKFKMIQAVVI